MSKKDIILVFVVLLLVGVVKLLRRGEVIINQEQQSAQPFYEHVDSPNTSSFPPEEFSGVRRVVVDNLAGSITVLPAENNVLTVQSTLVVFHPDHKTVAALQQRLEIKKETGPDGVLKIRVIGARLEDEGRFQVNHTLWLAAGTALEGTTRYGDIEIAHVSAELKLDLSFVDLRMSEVTGTVDIKARNSKLELNDISGGQRLQVRSCDIMVQNADRTAVVPRRSQVRLSNIREQVLITQALLSDIVVDTAPKVQISGSGDSISLLRISESTRVQDEFEDIELQDVAGEIALESKRSSITLRKVTADSLYVKNSYRDTRLLETRFKTASFELHQSDLQLNLLGIGQELNVDGVHSDVSLSVPAELSFSAAFESKMGRIVHEPDASFSETQERGLHSLSRQIPGAVKVRINTSYGDITINRTKPE